VIYLSSNELDKLWDRNIVRNHCHSILALLKEITKSTEIYPSDADLSITLLEIFRNLYCWRAMQSRREE